MIYRVHGLIDVEVEVDSEDELPSVIGDELPSELESVLVWERVDDDEEED